jgi:multicomponent Na+:H+ antiporter subunit F
MRAIRWLLGILFLTIIVTWILLSPPLSFLIRCFYIILLCGILCLYRILKGPTAADRAVAIDTLGILIVGFCAILSLSTGRSWYLDIAIAWALQSFIGVLALAKFLEGRSFDE